MTDRRPAWPAAVELLAGAVFALGLAVSGMTQPAKVVGFLDFFGSWDPSLAFVMLGAVAVYALAYRRGARRMGKPFFAERFSLPTRSTVDAPLVAGAAIFGIGWGLGGFCPGPGLVAFGAGARTAWWFVPAAVAGMLLQQLAARDPARGDG